MGNLQGQVSIKCLREAVGWQPTGLSHSAGVNDAALRAQPAGPSVKQVPSRGRRLATYRAQSLCKCQSSAFERPLVGSLQGSVSLQVSMMQLRELPGWG